eukprot:16412183-Heterocapsa_arctica.AAC.1
MERQVLSATAMGRCSASAGRGHDAMDQKKARRFDWRGFLICHHEPAHSSVPSAWANSAQSPARCSGLAASPASMPSSDSGQTPCVAH